MKFLALRANLLFVLGCFTLANMAARPANAQVAPSNAANAFVGRHTPAPVHEALCVV